MSITNPAEAAAFIRSRPTETELQQAVWAAEDAGHWSASRILRGAYDHALSGDLSAFKTEFHPDPTGVKKTEYLTGWNIAEDVRMESGLPETIQARIDAMRGWIAVKGVMELAEFRRTERLKFLEETVDEVVRHMQSRIGGALSVPHEGYLVPYEEMFSSCYEHLLRSGRHSSVGELSPKMLAIWAAVEAVESRIKGDVPDDFYGQISDKYLSLTGARLDEEDARRAYNLLPVKQPGSLELC